MLIMSKIVSSKLQTRKYVNNPMIYIFQAMNVTEIFQEHA